MIEIESYVKGGLPCTARAANIEYERDVGLHVDDLEILFEGSAHKIPNVPEDDIDRIVQEMGEQLHIDYINRHGRLRW